MMRLSIVCVLLLSASPILGFTLSRGMPLRPPLLASRYSRPQHVRSNKVQLQVLPENIIDYVPIAIYVSVIVGAAIANPSFLNMTSTTASVETVDVAVVPVDDVIAAEEEAMMKQVAAAEVEMVEAVKEVEVAPAPKPVVKTPPPEPAPKPAPVVAKSPPPAPKAVSPPPAPKPVAKPAPVTPAKTTTTAKAPAETKPEPTPAPKVSTPAPSPKFQVFRKKTEKSISDLKREVSSTLEGEKEKEERLRKAAAAREQEEKAKPVVVAKKDSPAKVATAATATAAATAAISTTLPKDVKLKKSTPSTKETTTSTTKSTETTFKKATGTVSTKKKGLRRKAWRVVKKVVAPWRKWENIS